MLESSYIQPPMLSMQTKTVETTTQVNNGLRNGFTTSSKEIVIICVQLVYLCHCCSTRIHNSLSWLVAVQLVLTSDSNVLIIGY